MGRIGAALQTGRLFGMRAGMLRLQYELQRSSGLTRWKMKMRSAQGWNSWDLTRIAPSSSSRKILEARRHGDRPFFFADARSLRSSLRQAIGPEAERLCLDEAERVLTGHLPLFGELFPHCGFPPQWFQNPVTGQSVSPRQPWTGMRFASASYGDLKFILEPSRFLFIYPLVRAYALTGDERLPQAFWNAIEDWALHSPPMEGPLWICGQECSLRILAWSFALHGFIHSPATTGDRVSLLVSMIAAQAWRISQTLDYARSQRSNHLITEAVGLWTVGTLYPELENAGAWQAAGARILRDAVLDQITPEGVSHQHSLNYQRMILHLLLWALRLSEIHQAPLSPQVRSRAQAALDFMRSWVDVHSGLAPNYGSDDGTLLFPLASASYRDFRPLLQLGAAILDRPSLLAGPWDEAPLWFGIKPETPGFKPETIKPSAAISSALGQTGYFRLGDADSWALIRAGHYARRPFQADQLHVDLWCHGLNLARDPGTYLYNGPAPWNNGLSATAVHNTVTVDYQDQMRRAGRFLWLDWAQASGRMFASNHDAVPDRFAGEHDGYRRLGVTHRRMVQWLKGAGWLIVDDIEGDLEEDLEDDRKYDRKGRGEHDLCLHWLTPDLPFQIVESPFRLVLNSQQDRFAWNIFSSAPATPGIIRGGKTASPAFVENQEHKKTDLRGWEASTYGRLRPAISIVCQCRAQLPIRFVTALLTDSRVTLRQQDKDIVIFANPAATEEVYRVNLAPASPIRSQTAQAMNGHSVSVA